MIIKVSKKHIENGKRGDAENCPIALAFKDKLGKSWQANITRRTFDAQKRNHPGGTGGAFFCGMIDEEITEYIKAFDGGEEAEPITIEIVEKPNNKLVLSKVDEELS